MEPVFSLKSMRSPLLVSIPHSGTELAPGMDGCLTDKALQLADTDWHVDRLYGFLQDHNASVLKANYSRYVVDLNRPADGAALYPGQDETGLCPTMSFSGEALYLPGRAPNPEEISERVERYWQPYHDALHRQLRSMIESFGYAILWDAHSIRSEVPLFFDGVLPDLNFGTNTGASCAKALSDTLVGIGKSSVYSTVLDGRFRGGYITRNYGAPDSGIHAVQLELAQCNYMDESSFAYREDLATNLQTALGQLIDAVLAYQP